MIQAGITGPPHAPERRLRVWSDDVAGAVSVRHAQTGAAVQGATVVPRPLPQSVAGDNRLTRRVVEIGNLPADALLEIGIGAETCRVLTMPGAGQELRLLLGSCFYLTGDGIPLWNAYRSLRSHQLPHLRLHCGDQLYMDAGSLPGPGGVFERSRRRYENYWRSPGYGAYLRGGASIFAPDDHEFWNDYPYFMPHLTRSWIGEWTAHRDAALALFLAYQTLANPGGKTWFELDLGMVSMFVLDTRTKRGTNSRNQPKRLFNPDQRQALLAWSSSLAKPGILVSAMPLLQKSTGKWFDVITTDHNLLAFPDDARSIWAAVEQAPHDVLVVAGDIHQGRMANWSSSSGTSSRVHHEVVSSPMSLLRWLSGARKQGKPAPSGLDLGPMGRRDSATIYASALDNFTLLRFNSAPSGVRVGIELLEIPAATVPASELPPHQPCQTDIVLS